MSELDRSLREHPPGPDAPAGASLCDVTCCLERGTHQVSVRFVDGLDLPGFTFRACYDHASEFAVSAASSAAVGCWFESVTDDAGDTVMVGDPGDAG